MKRKVVLFDIDYTLFNTEQFRDLLYAGIEKALKLDVETLGTGIYQGIRRELGYFNPNLFLKRLTKNLAKEVDEEVLREIIWSEGAMRACIYPEVDEVLTHVSKNALIGIFSKGHSKFQRAKLIAIKHFLQDQHIHVTVNKETRLPALIKKYEEKKLYLVDDALEVLWKAKELDSNIFTIWVKRGKFAIGRKSIKGFTPDETVESLQEVGNIVEKN